MAIDWKKERTDKNYCGYCIGSPPSANCDGSCFTRQDYTFKQICDNRKDHINSMLEEIPNLKRELQQREDDLRREMEQLS